MSNSFQDKNKNLNMGKKEVSGQKYIPNSGAEFKISSNFDKKPQFVTNQDSVNLFSSNKFDALKDLIDDNPFVYSNNGVHEVDLDYLDTVDQMEVIGGIPLENTNLEFVSNDD